MVWVNFKLIMALPFLQINEKKILINLKNLKILVIEKKYFNLHNNHKISFFNII